MQNPHLISRKSGTSVLQECGDFTWSSSDCEELSGRLLGGCLTVKNEWELLTGDDGVGNKWSCLDSYLKLPKSV